MSWACPGCPPLSRTQLLTGDKLGTLDFTFWYNVGLVGSLNPSRLHMGNDTLWHMLLQSPERPGYGAEALSFELACKGKQATGIVERHNNQRISREKPIRKTKFSSVSRAGAELPLTQRSRPQQGHQGYVGRGRGPGLVVQGPQHVAYRWHEPHSTYKKKSLGNIVYVRLLIPRFDRSDHIDRLSSSPPLMARQAK